MNSEGSIVALIIGALTALSVSYVCSLMEAALLSLSPGELATLERRKPKIGNIIRCPSEKPYPDEKLKPRLMNFLIC